MSRERPYGNYVGVNGVNYSREKLPDGVDYICLYEIEKAKHNNMQDGRNPDESHEEVVIQLNRKMKFAKIKEILESQKGRSDAWYEQSGFEGGPGLRKQVFSALEEMVTKNKVRKKIIVVS